MSASGALVHAVDPHAGERVLDVACGSGNTALVAARRHCEVSGIDDVRALLERATRRAAAEGVPLLLHAGRRGRRFFEIVGRYAPPPPGLAAPTRWGSEECVRKLLEVACRR
jgi:tRNA/tmRNA/rRNA uracil-C5-methylase (TrmA/RlmC/RlmD family)